MTSNRSSSNRKMTYAGTVFRRKAWVTALTVLVMFLFFVLVFGIVLNNIRQAWGVTAGVDGDVYTAYSYLFSLKDMAETYLGAQSPFLIVMTILAAISGIQGFSWLHRRTSADFYLSEPYTRGKQMAVEMLTSVFQTALFLAIFEGIGLLMARAFGVSVQALATTVVQGYITEIVYFLAVYMLAVFSCLISGTTLISVLVFIFFMAVEAGFRLTLNLYMSYYFKTYYETGTMKFLFSPVGNLFQETFAEGIVRNLIFAALLCLFSFLAFRLRPAEKAGKAFIFAPVYYGIKISTAVLAALIAGWFLDEYYYSFDRPIGASAIIMAVAAGLITCLVFEVIYSASLSGALKRLWQAALVCLGSVALIYAFKTDAFGYDSYIPKAEDVKDCAIMYLNDNRSYHSVKDGEESLTYVSTSPRFDDMHLTDVEAVIELARIGQEHITEERSDQTESDSLGKYVIACHMKNGRDVYRTIDIPEDVDVSLIDSVFGTGEYLEKYYFIDILSNNAIFTDNNNGELYFTYNTAKGELSLRPADISGLLREFLKVYRTDLEEYGRFSVLSESHPVGAVNFGNDSETDWNSRFNYSFPVFPEYENTLAFLEEKEIYLEEVPDASSVMELQIYKESYVAPEYVYSHDWDAYSDIPNSAEWGYVVTDPDTISQILDLSEAYGGDLDYGYDDTCYQFASLHRYRKIYVLAMSEEDSAVLLLPAGAALPEMP
ncbi:MAG: hypothetical protein K5637_03775 [Lachnospiraceae bacterium]|nr:hypothetical protein [Lachnospiraceae bacterium]